MRPHLYRLATALGLGGTVSNQLWGVEVQLEGTEEQLRGFLDRFVAELPPRAALWSVQQRELTPQGEHGFRILSSQAQGATSAVVLPDLATCDACHQDVKEPSNRRHRYAFTNCTDCGPRYSIVRRLPYDRPNTTMSGFALCPDCRGEYESPDDRRFHAQPNACPRCGPKLWFETLSGERLGDGDAALTEAVSLLRSGAILACKGLGGFHLMVDARSEAATVRLRARKRRWEKAMAVMVADLEQARALAHLDAQEERALTSAIAPLLLVRRREEDGLAPSVAPGHPRIGLMLAYSPLHRLLLDAMGSPVVATSGNLTDEPICVDNDEARRRLASIADAFLLHDRPIERPVDDSVALLRDGALCVLRRARGLAPMPLHLPEAQPSVLALGAHLKNSLCLTQDNLGFVSQHIGDLDSVEARLYERRVVEDFLELFAATPERIAHDLHADYASTQLAHALIDAQGSAPAPPRLASARLVPVQHHHAHLVSCLADNGTLSPALGVIWDGAGDGGDGTVWGGEFLYGHHRGALRVGHLLPFRLLGGDAAARDPRRAAASLWLSAGLPWQDFPLLAQLTSGEVRQWPQLHERGVRSPVTTSAGRLFDGLSALLGLCISTSYEGQAAMALEHAADSEGELELRLSLCRGTPFDARDASAVPEPHADGHLESLPRPWQLDWRPLLPALHEAHRSGLSRGQLARALHRALASGIAELCGSLGARRIALSGGCFVNELLLGFTRDGLQAAGMTVLTHRQLPAGDGGLCVGQALIAARAGETQ